MSTQIHDYIKKKRQWHKAFDLLQEIVLLTQSELNEKDQLIVRYEFIMNFLSRDIEEGTKLVMKFMEFIDRYEEFIIEKLLPLLNKKKYKNEEDG